MSVPIDLSRVSVLLLDDNRNFISIMRQVLRSFGIRDVHEATDAVAAFEILKTASIDIAFVDFKMPGFDGFEFARLVRAPYDSPNKFLPLILVTADGRTSTVNGAINAGFEEFLIKPIRPKDVYNRLVHLLSHPHKYVWTKTFFGPDRRRRQNDRFNGIERRIKPTKYVSADVSCVEL